MQWVIVFAFSVFATAYSASVRSNEKPIVCLNRVTSVCIQKLAQHISVDFTYCQIIPDTAECFKAAVKECGVDLNEYGYIQDFINILHDVCRPGTELNEKRLKHQDCLIHMFYDTQMRNCIGDLVAEVTKIPLPDINNPSEMQEYNNKVQKIACKYGDTVTNCAYNAVRSGCGNEAEEFVRIFYKPSVSLSKDFCRQSGYGR